ncbi:hypothetical protein Q4Q35_09665 [Flavivirga aquimarina]|uniref:Uncharacterized protein n=1 Tax=Flavivirga aquimarina TaxID=2027862 RepID=A0ABT8WAJ0_9FLAO|nr:hypothetical protein [Flavivirga aquimarina]MDO5970074.1 hypothetical protein [Flavivirga aquimarina]
MNNPVFNNPLIQIPTNAQLVIKAIKTLKRGIEKGIQAGSIGI